MDTISVSKKILAAIKNIQGTKYLPAGLTKYATCGLPIYFVLVFTLRHVIDMHPYMLPYLDLTYDL